MDIISVNIQKEPDVFLPKYANPGASGMDVEANLQESLTILPRNTALVPTGIRVAIPMGYEIQVRPRSGLALKHGITVLNTPGTIDADYRGEIKVILMNHSDKPFIVEPKMRIAQLVLCPISIISWSEVPLDETPRGSGGFGSTGTH